MISVWLALAEVINLKVTLNNYSFVNLSKAQTHKRFKRALFIRKKHNVQIFGAVPFTKLQNTT